MKYFEKQFCISPGAMGYGDRIWLRKEMSPALEQNLKDLSMWGGYDKSYSHLPTGEKIISFEFDRQDAERIRTLMHMNDFSEVVEREKIIEIFTFFFQH